MLIKLLEKYPIIAVNEGRLLGQMKGIILLDNKLTAILSSLDYKDELYTCESRLESNKYIHIPIESAIIGPDAFLIKKSTDANIHFSYGQSIKVETCIYTSTGGFVGYVIGVEVSHDYRVQGIRTKDNYIKVDCIKVIGDVIIIDTETDTDTYIDDRDSISENNEVFLKVEKEESDEEIGNMIISKEKDSNDYTEEITYTTTENPFDYIENIEEPSDIKTDAVYSKYRYLLGKKLLATINIADKTYHEDSVIDTNLVKLAINNNCILSLIMNIED